MGRAWDNRQRDHPFSSRNTDRVGISLVPSEGISLVPVHTLHIVGGHSSLGRREVVVEGGRSNCQSTGLVSEEGEGHSGRIGP